MSEVKGQKLKKLYMLPQDIPITLTQLKELKINSSLVNKYIKSGWLERLGKSVYKFPNKNISLEGILHVLQEILKLRIHLGSRSSLSYQNINHYLKNNENLYLYGQKAPK